MNKQVVKDVWEESEDVVCICCPRCAKFHEKSSLSDSKIKCTKCKRVYYAIVSDGIVVTFKDKSLYEHISEGLTDYKTTE